MTITDYFERIYIINLADRTDRRRDMERELRAQGVSPQDPRVHFFPAIRPADAGLFPSLGARGCFMSHFGILSEALRDCLSNVLVMEDDLSIAPRFHQCQADMLSSLNTTPWDIAYFGHIEPINGNPDAPTWVPYGRPMQCLHFYALNKRLITSLHAHLSACLARLPGHPDGSPMHVDGAYSLYRIHHPEVSTLIASPSLGSQRSSRSDIALNKWYDRTPILQEIVIIVRRVMNWRSRMQKTMSGHN